MTAFAIPMMLDDLSQVEGGKRDGGGNVGDDVIL